MAGQCVARSDLAVVSAGQNHSCVILQGTLSCWGSNANGQLGSGDGTSYRAPFVIGKDRDWVDVSLGARHSCGLRAPGALYCWGDNSQAQLGMGGAGGMRVRTPTLVGRVDDYIKLSCAGDNCCALRRSGVLQCWGDNSVGNTGTSRGGNNGLVTTPTPVVSNAKFSAVGVGASHSCAVTVGGQLLCWGLNSDGELGQGPSRDTQRMPRPVGDDSDWVSVACGEKHTCGVRTGGALLCWGGNDDGQVGVGREGPDGVRLIIDVPTAVDSSNGWGAVVAGAFHSCARKDRSNEPFCWGRASSGQLGVGDSADVVEFPTRIPALSAVRRFGLGAQHSCAFDSDRKLYCWGDNAQGQLGLGDTQRRTEPVLVGR